MKNASISVRGKDVDQVTLTIAQTLLKYLEELAEPSDPEVHLNIKINYGPTLEAL